MHAVRMHLLGGLVLTACGSDPTNTDWQVASWPTTLVDPVTAGARTFEVMTGEWRLDLAAAVSDAACQALDCPGPADGWDPALAAEGVMHDVTGYSARVQLPTVLWRTFDAAKATVDRSTGLGIGYGEVAAFYRRALDGALLVARAGDPALYGPDDFAPVSFADDGDRVRFVVSDPHSDATLRIEIQTEPKAVVVVGSGFAFRAERDADRLIDFGLPQGFEELAGSPSAARLVELIKLAETSPSLDGTVQVLQRLVAEILIRLSHDDPGVRMAAAHFQFAFYRRDANFVSKAIILDRVLTRLMIEPDPTIRVAIAEGVKTLVQTPDFAYHCILDWALEACASNDSVAAIASTCQSVLDLQLPAYGTCPWLDPSWPKP